MTAATSTVVGQVSAFAPSTAQRVVVTDVGGQEHRIAVVRIADTFYAIGDTCSHANVSLSDGTVWDDDCQLECPKHGSAFSVVTGEPHSFPATRPVPVYTVRQVGDDIVVVIPGTDGLSEATGLTENTAILENTGPAETTPS